MGLKKTDILQAWLVPAFSDILEASALRITKDGYFSYVTSRWESETGAREAQFEGHLSEQRLIEIQRELERLDFNYSPTFRIDDVGARELVFRHDDKIRSFELIGDVGVVNSSQEQIFDAVWRNIHSVVEETIRAKQSGADLPATAVESKLE